MTIDDALIGPLGWTLVHFIWQGLLIGLVHELALYATARRSPQLRYGISLLALLAVLASPFASFTWLLMESQGGSGTPEAIAAALPAIEGTTGFADVSSPFTLVQAVDAALPYVVVLWLLGVVILSLRFGAGLLALKQLEKNADFDAVSGWIRDELARLTERMDIGRRVRIALSDRVSSPLVVGWLKPMIFLPLSAATGLDHQQIRMVLAHELAHLSRHDHIVNLLQVVVETLLFYHPAVHRISRSLREEREQCCDDIAAGIGGNALAYARVLARLEEMRQRERAPALALGIAEQELFVRIQRLVGTTRSDVSPDRWLPAMLIAFAAIASLGRAPDIDAPLLPDLFEDARTHQRVPLQLPPVVSRPFRPINNNVATDSGASGAPVERSTASATATTAPSDSTAMTQSGSRSVEKKSRHALLEQQESLSPSVEPLVLDDNPDAPAALETVTPDENGVVVKTSVSTGGQLLHAVEPVYPRRARRAGEEGHVLLEFTITPEGTVADVDVLDASPRGWFENAARDAIAQWRYQPFTENGETVARRVTQTLEFRLVNEPLRIGGTPAGECKEQTGTRLCRAVKADDTELRVLKN